LIAVFLDRDGTICKDVHYMRRPEQFELLPGVAEGIKLLNELEMKVIVTTNQSGVARGYFTEADLKKIHERMVDELAKRGAKIDAIYYCPHHPNDNCSCRKPKTGMLERATQDFGLDLNKCFIVGDMKLDVETGRNAGCTSILVPTHETESGIEPDFVMTSFHEAVKLIARKIHG
jgi:histidinol-phosphate phosphatase family protein